MTTDKPKAVHALRDELRDLNEALELARRAIADLTRRVEALEAQLPDCRE